MQDDFETFGIPVENIDAAKRWENQQRKRIEYHTQVPTRKEVLTLPQELLTQLLIGWMVHSPIEIIPSRIQVEQVVELLHQRDDVDSLGRLLTMCRNYINNQ